MRLREGPGHPSFVFGTMHLAVEEHIPVLHAVRPYVEMGTHVYTETSLTIEDVSFLQDHIHIAESYWLEFVSQGKYRRMKAIFIKAYGLQLDQLTNLRPMFIISMIMHRILKPYSNKSPDQQIWDWAVEAGKIVKGLETAEEQVEILDIMPFKYDFQQLIRIGQNIPRFHRHVKSLVGVYQDQDIALLHKKAKQSLGITRKILLKDRNFKMADRIDTWHRKSPSFFCMGAGHLAGAHGILRKLKHMGFVLKPVKLEI